MASQRTGQGREGAESPPARRFLLGDAMALILVAAVVLSARGLFLWSWIAGNPLLMYNDREINRHSAAVGLAGVSFALLPFVLARPGDRRRLRRGAPGLLVHLVVVVAVGWLMVEMLVRRLVQVGIWKQTTTFDPLASALISIIIPLGMPTSLAVAIAWTGLAVLGRWKPDRGWDDRLGRLVGCLWLIYGPGEPLIVALAYLW